MLSSLVKPKKLLSVRDAAEENDIPCSFARSNLVIAGVIVSARGIGGMMLAH